MFHVKRRAATIALFALPPLAVPVLAVPAMAAPTRPTAAATERRSTFAAVIKGRVTEKESGQPILSAQVSVAVGSVARSAP